MFQWEYSNLVEAIESLASLLRFLFASCLLAVCGWSLMSLLLDAVTRAKQMHKIPCTNCRFFTNNHSLKCTVNPYTANTEAAIDCSDYQKD